MYSCKSKGRIMHSIRKLCMPLSMYAIVVCIVSGCDGGIYHNGPNTNGVFGFAGMAFLWSSRALYSPQSSGSDSDVSCFSWFSSWDWRPLDWCCPPSQRLVQVPLWGPASWYIYQCSTKNMRQLICENEEPHYRNWQGHTIQQLDDIWAFMLVVQLNTKTDGFLQNSLRDGKWGFCDVSIWHQGGHQL